MITRKQAILSLVSIMTGLIQGQVKQKPRTELDGDGDITTPGLLAVDNTAPYYAEFRLADGYSPSGEISELRVKYQGSEVRVSAREIWEALQPDGFRFTDGVRFTTPDVPLPPMIIAPEAFMVRPDGKMPLYIGPPLFK